MSGRRGFTLVEIMVYSLLLGLLMTGVYSAFYISRAYYDSAQGTTEVQQECLKALNGISRVLGQGNSSTVVVQSSPIVGFRILSARTTTGVYAHEASSGNVQWQRWAVVYYDSAAKEVRLKEVTGTGLPGTQVPNNPPAITAVASDGSGFKPLGRQISNLALSFTPATPNTAALMSFTIESTVQSQRFGTNKIEITSRITLKQ